MSRRKLPLREVYRLLEPGPVVLLTTAHNGRANVMTMSWHTMMEFEPPLIGCVVSNRNFTFDLLKTTKESVINIPTADMAVQVVGCGNTSGREVDKFKRFGLTAVTASEVGAPLIRECYANLECRVADVRMVSKYSFFILEVVKAWIDRSRKQAGTLHHAGHGAFVLDGKTIKLRSRMK